MNSSNVMVRHALNTKFSNLPAAAINALKVYILDTVGVGVAGKKAPYADKVFSSAKKWGTGSGAHVLARGVMMPPASAAFVNGFQIHCQEFDCVHEPAVVHPMATIFAALLAQTEGSKPVSGKEFLTAIAVAVDVAAGLGVAAKSGIRFFRPATAGIYGATLGAARLRGFNEKTALDALGYALAFCSGTMQAHVEGKPALPVQIGNAARGAVAACDLAGAGVPGANDVFEGQFGYLSLFEEEADLPPVLETLGSVWRISEVSHKPFPTGRAAQGGIVAVQRLREQGVSPENLDKLVLNAPPLIHRLVGRPYNKNITVNYARLCFAYCGAVTLLRGEVTLNDFDSKCLCDTRIAEIAKRIEVTDNGVSDPAAFTPQKAIAYLRDESQISVDVTALYGSPADPMSDSAHLEKFRQCMSFGLGKSGEAIASAIIDFVETLENQPDTGRLARLASRSQE